MNLNIKDRSQFKHGYLYAVRLLAASKRSGHEIARRLRDRGYSENTIGSVIKELEQQKLLDDQKLIRDTIHWAIQAKRYGRKRIIMELKKRGVGSADIEQALVSYSRSMEQEAARFLAKERWSRLKRIEPKKRMKRLYDFLASRGFDFEMCREIVMQMAADSDENHSDQKAVFRFF